MGLMVKLDMEVEICVIIVMKNLDFINYGNET